MKVKTKIDLKTIKTLKTDLEQRGKALFKTGEYARGIILSRWNQGKGASGDTLRALSNDYKEQKTGEGVLVNGARRKGQGLPDLMLTGDLQRGLVVEKINNSKIEITFVENEQGKAYNNKLLRPTIMNINSAMEKKITDVFRRIILRNITRSQT